MLEPESRPLRQRHDEPGMERIYVCLCGNLMLLFRMKRDLIKTKYYSAHFLGIIQQSGTE